MSEKDYLITAGENVTIFDSFVKMDSILNQKGYQNIACSISGGADSDIMIDMCEKVAPHKVRYVFFDTGLEYQATNDHLKWLEGAYGIEIERRRAEVPIPLSAKKFGQPFVNKLVSERIENLQRHEFDFQDRPFEEQLKLFNQNGGASASLKWFTNQYGDKTKYKKSSWNVEYNTALKEFLIQNPPRFKVSPQCCYGAKKKPSHHYIREEKIDLMLVGIRKAEGGVRSVSYKSCFDEYSTKQKSAVYRPLFWYTDNDRADYERIFNVQHSRCYTEYGLKRTGCVGCPFNRNLDEILGIIREHEPKLYKACTNIFGESYEYTRKYRAFQKKMKKNKVS